MDPLGVDGPKGFGSWPLRATNYGTFKNPGEKLRFWIQIGPQTGRTLAKNAWGGAHQPAQADSDRYIAHLSAELKGPRQLLRIRPDMFDFEPELGSEPSSTQPKIRGTVPTDRHTTSPNDSGPISVYFEDDPTLLNCEIAQSS